MRNLLLISLLVLSFIQPSFSAGSSSDSGTSKTDFEKAIKYVKQAKKYEEKGKTDKAQKRYQKAQKLLIASNAEIPNKADTLNYLGFTTRKLGDFETGEKYYLEGLAIEPNHIGINEYLGELYVATGRMEQAKKRLNILKNCNCKEFGELELIIKTRGTKVY